MPEVAARLNNLPPYVFSVIGDEIRQLQAQGHDVIRLDIGSPDMPPPPHVIEALAQSARQPNKHGYSGYRGSPAFRQAVANYYKQRFGVDLDPDKEVLPLIGSKEGLVNIALAYLDKGDISLVPDIAYPSYALGTRMAGAEPFFVPLIHEKGFLPDLQAVPKDVAQKAKLMWVNYPNNPTGATASLEDYQEIINYCAAHDILLVSDNPYCDVTFDGFVAPSILQIDNAKSHAVEFMSFSKTFNMAGWRLGAAVGSAQALEALLRIKSNIDSGHFLSIYDAGIAALEETPVEWLQERNACYAQRRDLILDTLPQIGLEAEKPKASLYVWAKVLQGDALEYTQRLRSEAFVSIAPGEAYGPGGRGYVRISLGVPDDRLAMALERMKRWFNDN